MPSFAQIFELCRNTTAIRTTVEDVNGWLFTASNGNSIFLPAAGYHYGAFFPDVDEIGYYWSRSLGGSPRIAYKLDFNSFEVRFNYLFDRYCGLSVRPVRKQ